MDFDPITDLSWSTDALKQASSESYSSVTFMDNLSNDLMHGNSLDHGFFQGSTFLGRTDMLGDHGSMSNPFMPSAHDSLLTEDAISSGSDNSGLQYSAPQLAIGEGEFDKFLDDPFPDIDLDPPSPGFSSTTAFIDPWRASTPTAQLDRPFKLVGRNNISFSPKSSSDASPRAALVNPFLQNFTSTTCNPVDVASVSPAHSSLEEIATPTQPNPLFQSPTNPRRLTAFPPSPTTPTKPRTSKAKSPRTKTKDARSPALKKRKKSRSTDDILEEHSIPSSNQNTNSPIKVTGSPSHIGRNQDSWAKPGSIQTTQESGLFNSRQFSAGAGATSSIDLNSLLQSPTGYDPSISHRSSDSCMPDVSSSLRNFNLFPQLPTSQDINSWPLNLGFQENSTPYSNHLHDNNIFSSGMTSSFDTSLNIDKPSTQLPEGLRPFSSAFDSNSFIKNFTDQSLAPSIHSSLLPSPHIQTSYNEKKADSPSVLMSQSRSDPEVYQQTFGKSNFSQDRASLPTSRSPDSLLSGVLNHFEHRVNFMANFSLASGGFFSGNQTSFQPKPMPTTAGPSTTISRSPVTPSNPSSTQKSTSELTLARSPSPSKPSIGAKHTPTRPKPLESVFVNFTPKDSQKLLSGVAPSGSSKRKRSSQVQPSTPSKRRIAAV
ncbi:uncharacterized protein MELLADRAFT_84740 [Melampsora larici-populina 98AG31]|uniref:Uncharacterized protein n=1 Tax=Melampsora larici-populina (strain 98AG31 / pathotype 3-4-7) TaxID=747676 RepID=F4RG39_MELLP|nr:uncharacterized protein MELLADRAFT_84740 [Melampsora larici-populina 98AG31]EGG08540.1 hypothetical protein MELLADRAFT_84740 [Melampsora larici-populina 98AG31]